MQKSGFLTTRLIYSRISSKLAMAEFVIMLTSPCNVDPLTSHLYIVKLEFLCIFTQGQLLEGVECHIYLYCFTFDDINLNRAFVIIVLFPKKYSNKKVCANDMRKKNALGIY